MTTKTSLQTTRYHRVNINFFFPTQLSVSTDFCEFRGEGLMIYPTYLFSGCWSVQYQFKVLWFLLLRQNFRSPCVCFYYCRHFRQCVCVFFHSLTVVVRTPDLLFFVRKFQDLKIWIELVVMSFYHLICMESSINPTQGCFIPLVSFCSRPFSLRQSLLVTSLSGPTSKWKVMRINVRKRVQVYRNGTRKQ